MTKFGPSGFSKLLLACICISTSPALANWQYTTWGMSPAQVVQASKGAVSLNSGGPGEQIAGFDMGAAGAYAGNTRPFAARFYFLQGRLALVSLTSVGDYCLGLERDLERVYGAPLNGSNIAGVAQTASWQDKAANNFVQLTTIGTGTSGSCSLAYKPLVADNARGL